jgi:ATP-dependent protease ClpP protease subunit
VQKISIFGLITSATSDNLKSQLEGFDRAQPLFIELNSDGGSVSDGVTIYNMLRGWPGGVTIEVVGWALSIASVILQAGSNRRAHEAALIMVHAPWTSNTGNSETMRSTANLLDQVGQTMLTVYRGTGQRDSVIQDWLDGTDHWFSATDAKALGLIDEVILNTDTNAAFTKKAPANAQAMRHPIPSIFSQRINTMITTPSQQTTPPATITAAQIESQRRDDIRYSFGKFAEREGVPELMAQCFSNPALTVQDANHKLLAHLGKDCTPIAGHYRPNVSNETRLTDFQAMARDVLLARAGIKVPEMHPGARDLARMGIVGMAESILSMQGKSTRDMSPSQIITASLVTDDFPSLLSNTAGKSLAIGYAQAPSGHALFTAERSVRDFKTKTLVNLSEAPDLEEKKEAGEYRYGAMYDGASSFQLATFGKMLLITREALINDDLSAFTTIPQLLGASARRLEADKVFNCLTSNPTLGDGVALFHANHGNLGSAAALSVASLAVARAAMRQQKGLTGLSYIDPQPKFLIVPVALETAAEQLLASLVDPSRNNSTPNLDFIRGLTLVSDPRLDAVSATAWYLSASPNQIEGILRAYLDGAREPFLEENTDFKRDTLSFKVRLDFAAGVMDYRGLYKNPGA